MRLKDPPRIRGAKGGRSSQGIEKVSSKQTGNI